MQLRNDIINAKILIFMGGFFIVNEGKFSGKAEIYTKFRPTYPDVFIDYLYSEVGFNALSVIADIGAGTGIFSGLLAKRDSLVICIEPNDDMMIVAKENLAGFKNCVFVKASAENTTLDDNSVDFITVAQAFHWFDSAKFKIECKRILKNRSKVALIWNSRDNSQDLTIENAKINKKFCPNFKGFAGGSEENPQAYADFFKNGHCDFRVFKNDLLFDKESFIGRNLSGSYAPKKGFENYDEYVEEIQKLFYKYSKNGLLTVNNITRSYIGEV